TLTVYAIARDASMNFVANIAADSWSLLNKMPATGGVVDGDLVPSANQKSAVFTGHVIGKAQIQAASGQLSQFGTGVITVVAGPAAKVRVETAFDGTGVVIPAQNITSGGTKAAYAITRDASDNFIANVAATWSLVNKTGGVVDS